MLAAAVFAANESLNQTPSKWPISIEMKSIQPYSTRDEYIYAMKEDLAEWFNLMYASSITAVNFTEELETGVMICYHANNVMRAAVSSGVKFESAKSATMTPSSKSCLGEYLLYRTGAKAQSFQARDNISNFISWCRQVVKVRECLMFETDDLILRKNEKNFILCLLEVARFGAKFGVQVPTIIQLEQEIEAEMALMDQNKKSASGELDANAVCKEVLLSVIQGEFLISMKVFFTS